MKKQFLFLLLSLFLLTQVSAQSLMRVEIEPNSSSENYFIFPIGKNGVMLFNENSEKSSKGEKVIEFTKYDANFQKLWTKEQKVGSRLELRKSDYDDESIYVLLLGGGYKPDYAVMRINIASGAITVSNGKMPVRFSLSDFKGMDGNVFWGGSTVPTTLQACAYGYTCGLAKSPIFTKPILMHTDMNAQTTEIVRLKTDKGSYSISDISKSGVTKTFNVVVSHWLPKKTLDISIHEFYANGGPKNEIALDPQGPNVPIVAHVTQLVDKNKIMIGTYSQASPSGKQVLSPYSDGIYIAKTDGEKQEFIKFYAFSEMKSFWKYIESTYTARQLKRIKKRARRGEEKGTKLDVNYRLLVHDVLEINDQYVMIAEAYYPEYHTEYYTEYVNGKAVTRSRQVFDGWRYTHAIICGFDKQGNMKWDNTFEIWDILTFDLKERVRVLPNDKELILAYAYGGAIRSKVIRGEEVVDGKTSTPIETSKEGDQVRSNYSADMAFWYDNYFITWGYQRIKNEEERAKGNKKKRTVFYFNKIQYSN